MTLTTAGATSLALDALVDRARELGPDDGFTVDPATGADYVGDGYAVSLPHGAVLYRPDDITVSALLAVLAGSPTGTYLGVWRDSDGTFYVDATAVIDSLTEALQLARDWSQLAIYSFGDARTIRTDSAVGAL